MGWMHRSGDRQQSRGAWIGRWGTTLLIAGLAGVGAFGCDADDGGGGPKEPPGTAGGWKLEFTQPSGGFATLSCADDEVGDTVDTLDYTFVAQITQVEDNALTPDDLRKLAGGDAELADLSLVLRLPGAGEEGPQPVSKALDETLRVSFDAFPLPLKTNQSVRVELVYGERVLLADTTTVTAEIDEQDEACFSQSNVEVSFELPGDGSVLTAADDTDGNVANDLQVPVRVLVDGAGEKPLAMSLSINGSVVAETEGGDGRVDFGFVTLPIGDGQDRAVTLVARAQLPTGEATTAEATVTIRVEGCPIEITSAPTDGECDVVMGDDIDPETNGVQRAFTVDSQCDLVVFTVNGVEMQPVEVVDGRAGDILSLAEGNNTIGVRGGTRGGLTEELDTWITHVDTEPPALALDYSEVDINRFDIASQAFADGVLVSTIEGRVAGMTSDAMVHVEFDPAIEGFDNGDIALSANGDLQFAVPTTGYVCNRTMTVEANDACGNMATRAYSMCFDAVQPRAAIMHPQSSTLTAADDVRPEVDGLQIATSVQLDDPRPAHVDYELAVECQPEGFAYDTRFTKPADRIQRSELTGGSGVIVVTFEGDDHGRMNCRATTIDAGNPPVPQAQPPQYFVALELPRFALVDPTPDACFADGAISITGAGLGLVDAEAVMLGVITSESGDVSEPFTLASGDGLAWGVQLGQEGGPAALADGHYGLQVSGAIVGGVPVQVAPAEPVPFTIDSLAPVVGLVGPESGAVLTLADDDNGSLDDCLQIPFRLSMGDANAEEVCFELNGAQGPCLTPGDDGQVQTAPMTLLNGQNQLTVYAVDCAGNRGEMQAMFTAVCGDAPRIQITEPAGGSSISVASDVDAETDGIQIDVRMETDLPEGAAVTFTARVPGVEAEMHGPMEVDVDGAAMMRISVPAPQEFGDSYELRLQGALAGGEAPGPEALITVITTEPDFELVVPEDCVNGQVADADPETVGFELVVFADTARIEPGREATLVATCQRVGGDGAFDAVEVKGSVDVDGAVAFAPIALPDEGNCTLEGSIVDQAGQRVEHSAAVQLDRVAPQIDFRKPADGARLGQLDDANRGVDDSALGFQLDATVDVCGADGEMLHVDAVPSVWGPEGWSAQMGSGDCAEARLGVVTMPLGAGRFVANVSDACGNETTVSTDFIVDPGATIGIVEPADGGRVVVDTDMDAQMPGCQTTLIAEFGGLSGNAWFDVCTSVANGVDGEAAYPEACAGDATALAGPCEVTAGEVPTIACPLSLVKGEHRLTAVGVFGERIASMPISLIADCTAPRVARIEIPQDGGDGCVNRHERHDPARDGDRAGLGIDFAVEDMEPGTTLTLQSVPPLDGPAPQVEVDVDGEGRIEADVPPGMYMFFLQGTDAAGNPLPQMGDPAMVSRLVIIDTVAPAPELLGVSEGTCLGQAESMNAERMNYSFSVRSNELDDPNSVVSELWVDGDAPVAGLVADDVIEFPGIDIGEGEHLVRAVVRDACGNAGSVAGFALADGHDDWQAPMGIPFRVDTVAPMPIIGNVDDGDLYFEDDDVDGAPGNGFQLDVTADLEDRGDIKAHGMLTWWLDDTELEPDEGATQIPENFDGPLAARLTLGPGAHDLALSTTDACGNEGISDPIHIDTPAERVTIAWPVEDDHYALDADADLAREGFQIDAAIDTNLPEGTEVTLAMAVDNGEFIELPPLFTDADATVAVQLTVMLPVVPTPFVDVELHVRLPGDRIFGEPVRFVVVTVPPTITIDPVADEDGCVDGGQPDADPLADGFQMAMSAESARIEPGVLASLRGHCGDLDIDVVGVVQGDGWIPFSLFGLADDVDGDVCELDVSVTDRAGQMAVDHITFIADRLDPSITFVDPADGTVTALDDIDVRELPEAAGIQFGATIEICGAAGQSLSVATVEALYGPGGHSEIVGEGDCSEITLPPVTMPLGEGEYIATAKDACGNTTSIGAGYTVDAGAVIEITSLADGVPYLAIDDVDLEMAGCQGELVAEFVGLGADADFSICTSFPQGFGPQACDGQASAKTGDCTVRARDNGNGVEMTCPISLAEGEHTISVVGEFGDRVISAPVNVRADCAAPTVSFVTVPQDGGDGCLNLAERNDPERLEGHAEFAVEAQLDGVEPGVQLALAIAGQPDFEGPAAIVDEQGQAVFTVDLEPGLYELYVVGTDEAGNPLPGQGEEEFIARPLTVDAVAPVPTFAALADGQCLHAGDSALGEGMQYSVMANGGAEEGEPLTGSLLIDANDPIDAIYDGGDDRFDWPAQDLAEGDHSIAVEAVDACGNKGMAEIAIHVDTIAPVLSLGGIADGQVFAEEDDVDGASGTGYQLDVTGDVDTRDEMQPGDTYAWYVDGEAIVPEGGETEIPEDLDGPLGARITFAPGPHAIAFEARDLCGNEARLADMAFDTPLERMDVVDPAQGHKFALDADLDGDADGIQLDVSIDTNLPEGTELWIDAGLVGLAGTSYGPYIVDADSQLSGRVTVHLPADLEAFVDAFIQARMSGDIAGDAIDIIIVTIPPEMTVDPVANLGDCLNGAAIDADPAADGFQLVVTADTLRVETDRIANLIGVCGIDAVDVDGTVAEDGTIAFAAFDLDANANGVDCDLEAAVSDEAGQLVTQPFQFTVDFVHPSITFEEPVASGTIGADDDADGRMVPEAAGVQFGPRIEICGAAGQSAMVATAHGLYGPDGAEMMVDDGEIGDGDCMTIAMDARTMPLGAGEYAVDVSDACGNANHVAAGYTVDPGASIAIAMPVDGVNFLVADDLDLGADGCQGQVVAQFDGLGQDADFDICSTFDQGNPSEACGGMSSVLTGDCVVQGGAAVEVVCPISMNHGMHDLTVTGMFGERIDSAAVSFTADCMAPSVTRVTVPQAGGDACINRAERNAPERVADDAAFAVDVEFEGVEAGVMLTLRGEPALPGEAPMAAVDVDGHAIFAADMPEGVYQLYVEGTDAAGNPLPTVGEGAVTGTFTVETTAPTPTFTNAIEGQCLNAADSAGGPGAMIYSFTANGGAEADEILTGALSIDGAEPVAGIYDEGGDRFDWPAQNMAEGDRTIAISATDNCGNIGTTELTVHVDTIAPVFAPGGIADAQVFVEGDDVDGQSGTGYQLDITADVDTRDEMRTGDFYDWYVDGEATLPDGGATEIPEILDAPLGARMTFAPGAHVIALGGRDICGNEGRTADIAFDTPPERMHVIAPLAGQKFALDADLDPAVDGIQLDVSLDTNLAAGTEITIDAWIDGDVATSFGPYITDAASALTGRVTLVLPALPPAFVDAAVQARIGDIVGPATRFIIVTIPPEMTVDPVANQGDCLNGAAVDADPLADGHQLAITAGSLRVEAGRVATLTGLCGIAPVDVTGAVGADGAIAYDHVSLDANADGITCDLEAGVSDEAGQLVTQALHFTVDFTGPGVTFAEPVASGTIAAIDDADPRTVPEAAGVQFGPQIEICGAAGLNAMVASTQGVYGPAGAEMLVGDGDCATIAMNAVTMPLGAGEYAVDVTDACGNASHVTAGYTVDPGAGIAITAPVDGVNFLVADDLDLGAAGCQGQIVAQFNGLGQDAAFDVCSTFDQGNPSEACTGNSSVRTGDCVVGGGAALEVVCPIFMDQGAHGLTVTGMFGERVDSAVISLTADCAAPSVTSVTVPQAGGDACINRAERNTPERVADDAAFAVDVQFEGVEAGVMLTLRGNPALPGDAPMAAVDGDGRAIFTADMPEGIYELYVEGTDAAGNPLPAVGEGAVTGTFTVETTAPTPAFTNAIEGQCLNGADSAGPGGMVYSFTATGGAEVGEILTGTLTVDGGDPVVGIYDEGGDSFDWPAQNMAEGDRTLSISTTDNCGNTGTTAISLHVDTVAPVFALAGIAEAQAFVEGADADGQSGTGFQLDVTGDVDTRDEMRAGEFYGWYVDGEASVPVGGATEIPEGLDAPLGARMTFTPGAHTIAVGGRDICGNEGRSADIAFDTPVERMDVIAPAAGQKFALDADLDPAVDGIQLDVTLDTNLIEGTEISIDAWIDGDVPVSYGPYLTDAASALTGRVTLVVPALPPAFVDAAVQARIGDVVGPVTNIIIVTVPPEMTVDPVANQGDCLNGAAVDADPLADGFQLAVTAGSLRVEAGRAATLTGLCGVDAVNVGGTVAGDGGIAFDFVQLDANSDGVACDLEAAVSDEAGQLVTQAVAFTVDFVAPGASYQEPVASGTIGVLDDADPRVVPEAAGIQFGPQIEICGAAGQTATVASTQGVYGVGADAIVGEGACANIAMDAMTMPLGAGEYSVDVTDACGNASHIVAAYNVDAGAVIAITSPVDGINVLAADDVDPGAAGCQGVVVAEFAGLGEAADFDVCTTFDQGDVTARCAGSSSVLNGACNVQGDGVLEVVCPISMNEGLHGLTVVGEFGERIESAAIAFSADCTVPSVDTVAIPQAGGDACLNRTERNDPARVDDGAAFAVNVQFTGVEAGVVMTLRGEPALAGDAPTAIVDGDGLATFTADVAQGTYDLYVEGTDEAGNPLPAFGVGAVAQTLTVETTVPTPSFTNVAPDQCLNAADSENPALMIYAPTADAGGLVDEVLTAELSIDGGIGIEGSVDAGAATFPAQLIDEGARSLTVTITDACGNAGTDTVNFEVDTVPPVPSITGMANAQVFVEGDDADANIANGYQLDVGVDFAPRDGIEAGQTVAWLSGVDALTTDPTPVTVPGGLAAPIPVRVTFAPGAHAVSVQTQDACGNAATSNLVNITTPSERFDIIAPANGSRVSASSDLDGAAADTQLDVALDTNLPENTEVDVVMTVDGELPIEFGPALVGADGTATVRVTVAVPGGAVGNFDFTLQGQLADGGAVGGIATITYTLIAPTVSLVHPVGGDCLNGDIVDALPLVADFQVEVTATSTGVPEGTMANLIATCGVDVSSVTGAVGADGSITFDPVTTPDLSDCTLDADVEDDADQIATNQIALQVDRVPPALAWTLPTAGETITSLDDEDTRALPEAAGVQVSATLNVCGAAQRPISFTSTQDLYGGDGHDTTVPNAGCANVQLPQVTMPLGAGTLTADVSDTCGNNTVLAVNYDVDTSPTINVTDPANAANIKIINDDDTDTAGCQIDLFAQFAGLGIAANFEVCTDQDQGAGPVLCAGQSSALADVCLVQGDAAPFILCPITLDTGTHVLTVVGEFGETVQADPITVTADCEAPSVVSITVPEDTSADDCINRHERQSAGAPNNIADFTVAIQTSGIEEGVEVFLRASPAIPGNAPRATVGADGTAVFSTALDPGSYAFRVEGTDQIGNSLPLLGAPGLVTRTVEIETVAPAPSLVNLAAAQCLNAADSEIGGGMQYSISVNGGGQLDEELTAELSIDGGGAVAGVVAGDSVTFPNEAMAEGAHTLAITVTDACGNVGSINGFTQVDELDDWTQPIGVSYSVDSVAPVPSIGGVAEAQVFTDVDDVDADNTNGFQIDVDADFAPRDGIEAGQQVRWFSGAQALTTTPTPINVPDPFDAAIDARLTLPPGNHALKVKATDTCGNEGVSAIVNIDVQVDGCSSIITGFAENPTVLNSGDGVVNGNDLDMTITGTVDLLNLACATGTASLLVDGFVTAGPIAIGAEGDVTFDDVTLPEGDNDVQIRVTLDAENTDSLAQTLTVDLIAPTTAITTPAGAEPVAITSDSDGVAAGQQTTIVAQVTESARSSARTARLLVDAVQDGAAKAVGAGSPVSVNFAGVTLTAGAHTLQVCTTDVAANETCDSIDVNVDPQAPGGLTVTPAVVDARRTTVDLGFTAPGDDGAGGGRVTSYEVRHSSSDITNEGEWDAADSFGTFAATVDPGVIETIRLDLLLDLNQNHFVAVRATDDVDREGAFDSAAVDLTFDSATYSIDPQNAVEWGTEWAFSLVNEASMVRSAGDVDGDGRNDIVAGMFWLPDDPINSYPESWNTVLVLGNADPTVATVIELEEPIVDAAALDGHGVYITGIGDVNADGLADIAAIGYDEPLAMIAFGLAPTWKTVVAIYLGDADPAELATPDAVITMTDRQATFVAGVGNFNHLAGDLANYDDIVIGGDNMPGTATNVYVVSGRATGDWPAVIDLDVLDAATGITELSIPEAKAGRFISGAGDLDGDGLDDVAFSAGGSFNNVYVFAGQAPLAESYTYNALSNDTVKLAHPCPDPDPLVTGTFGSYFSGGFDLTGDGSGDLVIGDRSLQQLIPYSEVNPATETLADLTNTDCAKTGLGLYGSSFDIAGDIDGDGALDLIATHQDADPAVTEANILYNDGNGLFGQAAPGGTRTADVTIDASGIRKLGVAGIGDFDNDGDDDIAVIVKQPAGNFEIIIYY